MSEFIFSPAVQGNLPIGTGNFYVVKYTGTFDELLSSSYLSDNFNDKDMLHISSSNVSGVYLYNSNTSQLDIVSSGSINWGTIYGTLSDQSDLNNALNNKINISDIATGSDIESQTTGKVIDATAVIDDITLASNSKQKIPSEFSVKSYVDDKVTGIYKPVGTWDASSGSFPSGAKIGYTYYVNVAGTVDNVSFSIGDKLSARVDNASTTTYSNNWSKFDNNDDVTSVFGRIGAITASNGDYNASQVTNSFDKSSDTSDNIIVGTTNFFVTSSEKTAIGTILETYSNSSLTISNTGTPNILSSIPIGTGSINLTMGDNLLQRVGNMWTLTIELTWYQADDLVELDISNALSLMGGNAKIMVYEPYYDSGANGLFTFESRGANNSDFTNSGIIKLDRANTLDNNSPVRLYVSGTVF